MSVNVQGPDGNTYQFPDGTDKTAAIAYFKKKGIGVSPVPTTPQPESRTAGNYAKESLFGLGRGLKNTVVGLGQTIAHPYKTVTGMRDQLKEADAASQKEFQDLGGDKQDSLAKETASALTFAEHAPVIGGMVQYAERGGTKPGSPEAVGAGVEAATTLEAPKLAGEAIVAGARALPEMAAKATRAAAGAGPKTVRDLVKQTAKDNEVIGKTNAADAKAHADETIDALHETEGRERAYQQAVKTTQDNAREAQAALDKQHEEAVQKALQETREKEELYQADLRKAKLESEDAYQKKLTEVQKKRSDADAARKEEVKQYLAKKAKAQQTYEAAERKFKSAQEKQGKIAPTTSKLTNARAALRAAVETARENALKVGNEKYNTVNKVLNPALAQPQFYEYVASKASDEIAGSKGAPTYLKAINQRVKSGAPIRYEDLQSDYSNLGRELSKGTLPGDVYHAYDVMHEAIGDEMQRIADSQGMGAHLTDARSYWRRMKQTFGKPITFTDAANKAIGGVKDEAQENAIRLLGSFDPSIPGIAAHVANIEKGVASLPEPVPGRKLTEQLAKAKAKPQPEAPRRGKPIPDPNPVPPKDVVPPARTELPDRPPHLDPKMPVAPERVPIEDRPTETPTKTIGPKEVSEAKGKGVEGRQQLIERAAKYRAIVPLFYAASDIVRGELPSVQGLVGTTVAPLAIQAALTKILTSPKVVDFLTKATPADVAQIPPELRGNFPKILTEAQKRGIKVSPALTAGFTTAAIAGKKNDSNRPTP